MWIPKGRWDHLYGICCLFEITNGVKQGCVLAPTLLSLMFSTTLRDALNESEAGIDIRYRYDGSLFNLRRFQVKNKVSTDMHNDFLFADDCAINATSERDM